MPDSWLTKDSKGHGLIRILLLSSDFFRLTLQCLVLHIMKTVTAEKVIHKGDSRIALRFPYDKELLVAVKGFSDARWSEQMKC
jgi:hypothetical protein